MKECQQMGLEGLWTVYRKGLVKNGKGVCGVAKDKRGRRHTVGGMWRLSKQ